MVFNARNLERLRVACALASPGPMVQIHWFFQCPRKGGAILHPGVQGAGPKLPPRVPCKNPC